MNTFLSAAQQAAKEQYQAYAEEHLAPVAQELEQHKSGLKEFLQELGQAGYLGITIPKEYGGQGLSFLYAALFAEVIGAYQPSLGLVLAEYLAVVELIKRFGDGRQKSRYLPLLARGECFAATAFSEETAGTDFNAIHATAEKQDEQLLLSGTKTLVVNGETINLCLVSASGKDGKPIVVLVDLSEPAGSIKVVSHSQLLGLRACRISDIEFNRHKVPADSVLQADSGGADEQILFGYDVAKTVIAATALGMLATATSSSVDYANSREQFGKKIGQFQAVQWKLADMCVEASASRLLVYRAAWSMDEEPESFRKDAAMCKWFASRAIRIYSGEWIQILGARGLLSDTLPEQFYRDAKVMDICEGTSEFQKILIAQELGV